MTKTMEINELISELKEYDDELPVKVFSNGADKAYPISHVGQGHTDGVLDTYVGIVVADDDNLVDLAKVEIGEEAFCAVFSYCNCGICVKSSKCQLSLQHMCLRGRAFYDGFIKGAKISKGYEIGVDDRNLVDLSKIWHDASQMPKDYFKQIIYQDKTGTCRFTIMHDIVVLLQLKWDDFAAENISRWAYISDLLPKGGEK